MLKTFDIQNALLISSLAKKMIIRVPVIPGFNASPNVIAAIVKVYYLSS